MNYNGYVITFVAVLMVGLVIFLIWKTKIITVWKTRISGKKEREYEDRIFRLLNNEVAMRNELDLMRMGEKILQVGSWSWDLSTTPNDEVVYSENFANIFSVPIGQKLTAKDLIDRIYFDDRYTVNEMLEKHFINGLPYVMEYRIVKMNRRVDFVRVKGEPILSEGGKTIKVTGTIEFLRTIED